MSLGHEHTSDPVLVGHRAFAVCRAMVLTIGLLENRESQWLFFHTRHLPLCGARPQVPSK